MDPEKLEFSLPCLIEFHARRKWLKGNIESWKEIGKAMLKLALYVDLNPMQEDGRGKQFERVPSFLTVSLRVATHEMNRFLLFNSNYSFNWPFKDR